MKCHLSPPHAESYRVKMAVVAAGRRLERLLNCSLPIALGGLSSHLLQERFMRQNTQLLSLQVREGTWEGSDGPWLRCPPPGLPCESQYGGPGRKPRGGTKRSSPQEGHRSQDHPHPTFMLRESIGLPLLGDFPDLDIS